MSAIALRRPPKGCIHHKDRGSQCRSHDYQTLLSQHGLGVSMRQRSWRTRRDAEMAILEYINGFKNPRRRHSALGWKSPLAFERKAT